MHRVGVPLFFWGEGEMAANSCAAEIGQARLLGKTGSASKAESACQLCVFLGIQKIFAKMAECATLLSQDLMRIYKG